MRPLDPRLLPHLRPAAPSLTGVVAASVLGGVLLVAQAFAVTHLLVVLVHGATAQLPWATGLVAGAFALRALVGYVGDVCAAHASATVSGHLRHRLTQAVLDLPPQEMSEQRSGELSLLVTRGVTAIEPYLTRYLPALVLAVVLPPLTLVAIGSQDLLSAGIVVATLPLVPVFAVLVGLATRDRADRQWRTLSTLAGHFVDVMRGLPTLVVHRRAAAQSATIRRTTDAHRRASLATLKLAFASSAVLELVATLSVALVAVVVGLRLAGGSLDLGTALVVLLLAPEAYWPLRKVGAEFHAAAEGTATLSAAQDLFDAAPPVEDAPRHLDLVTWPGVAAHGLRVTYPGRTTPALDLSGDVVLPARSLVAVVGLSGCGKSTLLSVLAGELAPDRGRVTAGDLPLGADTLTRWREQVSWVPQRPWLQSGTVRDNVRVARPDADDSAIWGALARVGLREVVAGLPGGLDAAVGEDGGRLSAGQRARLALARAVLADRPLVLVDEPSAHLDAHSEDVILDALTWLARRSTVVVVTHSHRVLDVADHVVRLPAPQTRQPVRAVAGVAPRASGTTGASTPPRLPAGSSSSGSSQWAAAVGLGIAASTCGVALTVTSGWLITRAAEHPPVLYLMVAIVAVRTFGIGRPVLRYVERLLGHDGALRMLADRRADVYDTVVPLTPGALGRRRGDVLASVVDDVDALLDDRLRVRSPLLGLVGVGVLAAVLAAVVLPVAAALAAGLVAYVLLVAAGVRWSVGRSERDVVRLRALLSAAVLQAVQGARDLVMWQATSRAAQVVDDAGSGLLASARRSASRVALGRAAVVVGVGAALAGLGQVVGPEVTAGRLRAPVAAALVLLPLALLDVLLTAPDAAATSVRTHAAKARLADLAATVPAVTSPSAPLAAPEGAARLTARDLRGGWENVVFEGLHLDARAGSRIGVVGPSGCGKSTLAAVLVRFLDPVSGRVDLDGVDLRSLDLDEAHRLVGLVDDDPYVFSSTVLENVRLARPDASPADIESALRRVSLGPWLDALPDGLDTWVGEGHAAVSGGERARLGLARALLADNPVLVLDEPTAHLDASTAAEVARDVLDATEGRAVVWITHDAVALAAMDEIVDLASYAVAGGATGAAAGSADAAAGAPPPRGPRSSPAHRAPRLQDARTPNRGTGS